MGGPEELGRPYSALDAASGAPDAALPLPPVDATDQLFAMEFRPICPDSIRNAEEPLRIPGKSSVHSLKEWYSR